MFKLTRKILFWGFVGTVGVVGTSYLVCGEHALSYLKSSTRMLKSNVKDSIPIDFEIQRARDLLEDLVPEMRANLRLVAAEEVEVANLEKDMRRENSSIQEERGKVQFLRDTLKTRRVSYELGSQDYTRAEVVEELARRFEQLRTAEMIMKGKKDLLRNRQRSLDAALKKLEKTRLARVQLESQIEALSAQFRLLQAQSTESEFHLDESKLTQTQEIISELKKRLEVAQRVLAREAKFVEMIPIGKVQETSVVQKIDDYFSGRGESNPEPEFTAVNVAD